MKINMIKLKVRDLIKSYNEDATTNKVQGWEYKHGGSIARNNREVLLVDDLTDYLQQRYTDLQTSDKDKNKNSNFHEKGNRIICTDLSVDYERLISYFNTHKKSIVKRGENEIKFWEQRIKEINSYSKERAIKELIIALKLKEKINAIKKYIETLRD